MKYRGILGVAQRRVLRIGHRLGAREILASRIAASTAAPQASRCKTVARRGRGDRLLDDALLAHSADRFKNNAFDLHVDGASSGRGSSPTSTCSHLRRVGVEQPAVHPAHEGRHPPRMVNTTNALFGGVQRYVGPRLYRA
jgi:hypothetical protein